MGLVVAAGYLLSLSIGQEGGRDVESWAAHLHVVVCPMYAMRVTFVHTSSSGDVALSISSRDIDLTSLSCNGIFDAL